MNPLPQQWLGAGLEKERGLTSILQIYQRLARDEEGAAKIERDEPVMPPGGHPNYPEAKKLVTEDCIKPNT